MPARPAVAGLLLLGCLGLGACAHGAPASAPPPAAPAPTPMPSYDAAQPPARAVLALVPAAATTVQVTDLTVIRHQVGLPALTGRSGAAERAAFWAGVARESALLAPGPITGVDARLRAAYGFGEDDVDWEARFSGGGTHGWVVALRPGLDLADVRRAVRAGVGPLRGAHLDVADRLVTRGVPAAGAPVWAADPVWTRLLPATGEAFLLRRGCLRVDSLPGPGPRVRALLRRVPPDTLQPLTASTLTFGDHVATVRVRRDRDDLFDRLDLAKGWPVGHRGRFGDVFRAGVGDPAGGRIGFDVPRPDRAVALLREGLLPYAACGGPA